MAVDQREIDLPLLLPGVIGFPSMQWLLAWSKPCRFLCPRRRQSAGAAYLLVNDQSPLLSRQLLVGHGRAAGFGACSGESLWQAFSMSPCGDRLDRVTWS